MNILNPHSLPEAYVRAVSEFRTPERGRISVTELISPPQQRSLLLQHWDDIEVEADAEIDKFFGSAVHERLARYAGADALAEETLTVKVDGWEVHGTLDHADWMEVMGGTLLDWKTTRVRALGVERAEWTAQLNLYAHLLALTGMPVERLVVKAFLRDFDRARMRTEPDYPAAPIVEIAVPAWDAAERHAYLLERLRLHRQAARGFYPPCSAEEQWRRDAYAVYKAGNTRATRTFPSLELAQAWAEAQTEPPRDWRDWYRVGHRPGDPIRCRDWCLAAQFCAQHADEMLDQPAAEIVA